MIRSVGKTNSLCVFFFFFLDPSLFLFFFFSLSNCSTNERTSSSYRQQAYTHTHLYTNGKKQMNASCFIPLVFSSSLLDTVKLIILLVLRRCFVWVSKSVLVPFFSLSSGVHSCLLGNHISRTEKEGVGLFR